MASRLRKLCREAEDLGVDDSIAELIAIYMKDAREADRAYEAFHWGETSDRSGIIRVRQPSGAMYELGELVRVVYEASKDGETFFWDHPFESVRPRLIANKNGDQLWIAGGSYRVEGRGIVG